MTKLAPLLNSVPVGGLWLLLPESLRRPPNTPAFPADLETSLKVGIGSTYKGTAETENDSEIQRRTYEEEAEALPVLDSFGLNSLQNI